MFSEALAQRLVSVSADVADLRAWKQSVYLYERLVLPCAFIAELPQNLAPACIADLPCQIRALLKHLSDIEAFCTDQVIFALRDLYDIRIRWQRHDDLVDLVVQRLTEDVDAKLVAHHKLIQIGNPCEYTSKNLPGL